MCNRVLNLGLLFSLNKVLDQTLAKRFQSFLRAQLYPLALKNIPLLK